MQYGKVGRAGIFSHVSDVKTNEKLMNVVGLTDNGVIAHALMVREFVCEQSFATSVQCVRFCQRLKTEKNERIAGVSASLPWLLYTPFCVCNAGKAVHYCIDYSASLVLRLHPGLY